MHQHIFILCIKFRNIILRNGRKNKMIENNEVIENDEVIVESKRKVSAGKFLAWNSRGISMAASSIIIAYLTIYATDTVGIAPALVGTLLLTSKILDIVFDLFLGLLIDKSPETRFGKARPYEFAVIGVWLGTIAMFSIPSSLGMVSKSIWLFTTYTLVHTLFTSLLSANGTLYTIRAFKTRDEITKVSSFGGILITLGAIVVSISFPILMSRLATSSSGWTTLITIYAVPMMIIGMMRFLFVKETVKEEANSSTQPVDLKAVFETMKKNRYIWVYGLMLLPVQTVQAMNVGAYYYKYIVGDVALLGIVQIVGVLALLVMMFYPKLINKFSVSHVITFGVVIGMAGFLLNFFAGDNLILLGIAFFLTAMAPLPTSYLSALLVLNLSAYNELVGLPRLESTISSIGGLFTNIGMGLGAAIVGGMLSLSGYDGSAGVQSDTAMLTIRLLFSFAPIIIYSITLFATSKFSRLEKQMIEMNRIK